MKIKVKPEGRPNVWLPDRKSLKDFIVSRNFVEIHNFIPTGSMFIGANHSVKSVLQDIDDAERLAVFTDDSNMKHALAIIRAEKLEIYDIGKIKKSDLIIIK
jgi:hypothetical protein